MTNLQNTTFHTKIIELLQSSRNNIVRTVNHTMTTTYFEIGRMIVEQEQAGKNRAEYGKGLLKGLSQVLAKEFGRGFSVDNLENMRRFYLTYQNSETLSRISDNANSETMSMKFQTLSKYFKLSWSHYLTFTIYH